MLPAAAIAEEPRLNDEVVVAAPKEARLEEVVVTTKRPPALEAQPVLVPVVRIPPPSPCTLAHTARCRE
jgi:hypothetical protein